MEDWLKKTNITFNKNTESIYCHDENLKKNHYILTNTFWWRKIISKGHFCSWAMWFVQQSPSRQLRATPGKILDKEALTPLKSCSMPYNK